MQKRLAALVLLVVPLSSGCAFYEKNFVSEIVLEGENYRPKIYDEGAFYVNAEPPVRMRMGCFASSTMVATMFPLIPLPFGKETKPHESIAARNLSLTLRHYEKDRLNFSTLPITLEIGARVYPLKLVRKELEKYGAYWDYEFAAELSCGAVQEGQLRIELDSETVRTYGVQFEEGVRRDFAWHPTFVT